MALARTIRPWARRMSASNEDLGSCGTCEMGKYMYLGDPRRSSICSAINLISIADSLIHPSSALPTQHASDSRTSAYVLITLVISTSSQPSSLCSQREHMVNGSPLPPLPAPIIPSCTLPNMSGLPTDSTRSSWTSEYSTRHPHPLRSHSSEMLSTLHNHDSTSQLLGQESTASTQVSGLSRASTLHSTKTHRHRRSLSQHHIRNAPTYGLPSLPAHPTLRSSVQEGFSDCSVAGAGRNTHNQPDDFPIVPVRPPLRPTVSFGGISRFSYYSDISTEMEHKSKMVAAIEEKEVQVKFDVMAATSRKPLAFLIVSCLLGFGMGLSTTALATALPVSCPNPKQSPNVV